MTPAPVNEVIVDSEILRSIYDSTPALGGAVRVGSININWRGPTAILRIDLPGLPEPVPREWLDAGLDTVQIDSTHGPEFLIGDAQLAKYRTHMERMERIALSPEASRDFILDIANSL